MSLPFDHTLMQSELTRDEGRRTKAYKDSLGNWTIGVGHLLGQGDYSQLVWTDAQVNSTLEIDIQKAYDRIANTGVFLAMDSDARRRALVNMSFQLGNHFFEFNHSMALLVDHRWSEGTDHLRESLWYSQTPERAERVLQQLLRG